MILDPLELAAPFHTKLSYYSVKRTNALFTIPTWETPTHSSRPSSNVTSCLLNYTQAELITSLFYFFIPIDAHGSFFYVTVNTQGFHTAQRAANVSYTSLYVSNPEQDVSILDVPGYMASDKSHNSLTLYLSCKTGRITYLRIVVKI